MFFPGNWLLADGGYQPSREIPREGGGGERGRGGKERNGEGGKGEERTGGKERQFPAKYHGNPPGQLITRAGKIAGFGIFPYSVMLFF